MSLLQVHIRQVKYRYKHISVIQIHIIHTNQLSALHTYYGSRCVQYRYTPHKCTTDAHHISVLQIHTTQVYYRYTPHKCTTYTHHTSVLQIHTSVLQIHTRSTPASCCMSTVGLRLLRQRCTASSVISLRRTESLKISLTVPTPLSRNCRQKKIFCIRLCGRILLKICKWCKQQQQQTYLCTGNAFFHNSNHTKKEFL